MAKLDWPATGAELERLVIAGGGGDGVFTDPTGDFARIYGLTRDTLLLIRPDGYVGHIAIHEVAETTRVAVRAMTPQSAGDRPARVAADDLTG